MFLTTEDLKKIEKYLSLRGIKDTELDELKYPFTGSEIMSLVSEGKNYKVPLRNLVFSTGTVTVGPNGNWFNNGVDTGIKAQGPQGEKGEKGDKGDKGEPGESGSGGPAGDITISTKTVFAFKASDTKPEKPSGGYWDYETNIVTYPEGWSSAQDELIGIIWMSFAIFNQNGEIDTDWSEPLRISGEKGEAGEDGISIEFIYKLTTTSYEKPSKPDNKNEDKYIPEGWTNHPSGISENFKVEWVCSRERNSDGTWEDWEGPSIWSKWGENGMDGDGGEYIYKTTSIATPPERPTEISQDDDFVPEGWTDNPTGIDAINQWEWVCYRKYSNNTWGAFSNPALWAKYGEQGNSGDSIRIMYAKTESSSVVPECIKDNINPGSIWGIGIPNYSGTEAVWAIQGTINYKNELVSNWEGPYLITGINGKDGVAPNYTIYVFKQSNTAPSSPTSNNINPGDGWVDYPTGDGTWWMCVGTVNGVTGLVESWGTPIKINGKDGAGAVSIKSIKEFYGISNSDSTVPTKWQETPQFPTKDNPYAWNKEVIYYSDDSSEETSSRIYAVYTEDGKGIVSITNYYKITETDSTPSREDSDWGTSPVVPNNDFPYAWNYEDTLYSDNTHSYTEVHIIAICGKDGVNGVSISEVKEFYGLSDNIDTPPSEWKDTPQIPTELLDFAWNYEKITYDNGSYTETQPRIYATYVKSGKDGISITNIRNYYKLTNTESKPTIEEGGWSESVLIPSDINKYLWNYEVIEYSDDNSYNTGVRLLCRYGQDGGFYQLSKELYGLSNDTSTPPTEWVETPVTPTSDKRYAWIKEEIANNEGDSKYTNPRIYAFYTANGVDGVSVTNVVNYYKLLNDESYIGTTPSYEELTSSWSTEPINVTKETPYLYNVEVVIYSNDSKTITSARIIANYSEDGTSTEFRFAVGSTAPELDSSAREPSGWDINPPSDVPSGQYVWMIVATIDSSNNLVGTWRGPTRISGEEGPKGETGPAGPAGPTGSQGTSGIPGVSYINLYFGCTADADGNIDYSDDSPTMFIKILYDAYKTDINISEKGTIDDPLIIDYAGEEEINEIKETLELYRTIIETGTNPDTQESLSEEEIRAYKNTYNQMYFTYYNGLKFVPNISDLYIEQYQDDGTIVKVKMYPYIGFIQARVTFDEFGNYIFDGVTEWSEPTILTGVNGLDGKQGATGVGISSIIDYYKLTSNYEAPLITTSDSTIPLSPNKKYPYLWVREYISYSNGNHSWSSGSARLLTKYVEDAVGIQETITTYAVSSSSTTPPSSWSTSIPSADDGEYLWTNIEIRYTDGTKSNSYTVVKNGLSANGIERIEEYYGLSNSSKTSPTQWFDTPQTPTSENRYAWNKEITIFTNSQQQESKPHIYAIYTNEGTQGEPGVSITKIVNYYCASKSKETPSKKVSSDENIVNRKWYDDDGDSTELEEFLSNFPNKDYPYLYNYEEVYLSSGTIYSGSTRLISTYVENASGTINLYWLNILNTGEVRPKSYKNDQFLALFYPLFKNEPNINNIKFSKIGELNEDELLNLIKEVFSVNSWDDWGMSYEDTKFLYTAYGEGMPTFSNSLTYTVDDKIYGDPECTIYMISANVIITSSGYKFAEGTTSWTEPVIINPMNGQDGKNGQDGAGISDVDVSYTLSSSNTEIPSSNLYSWQSTVPTTTSQKPYVWQRTQYKNGASVISTTYNLYNVGKDGVSVNDITEYYCVSSTNNIAPSSGWTTSVPTMTSVNRYLWNYEVFHMSDGSTKETSKRVIGVYGRDGEAVGGIGISSIDEYYIAWTSGPNTEGNDIITPSFELDEDTGTPTSSLWNTTFPTTVNSLFRWVWNVEVVKYTDNSYYVSEPSCIYIQAKDGQDGINGSDGAPGKDGQDGQDGVGIKSITNYYLRSSLTSGVTVSTSGWTTSVLTPTVTQRYIWNYEKILYTDGNSYTSTPHIIAGLGADGTDGEDGRKGQLVYPAGVYSNTTSYTTDQYKAPYVLDPSDGNFYVLNAQMTWKGTSQSNRTPAQDYTQNKGAYWLKFDAFEAIYAKIGIIANGLIGSAVFNGDWMFSQYGINYNGTRNSNYENFNSSWITLTKFTSSVTFVPIYAVNLRTGIIYIHGTGSSSSIPSLTIDNGSITFIRKSYYSTTNYTTKIINGNTVYHADGGSLLGIKVDESSITLQVLGICIGTNPSALIYNGDTYYKLRPAEGILGVRDGSTNLVDNDGYPILSIRGILYLFDVSNTVSGFSSWLSSIN